MSLKSRIREVQREAARRTRSKPLETGDADNRDNSGPQSGMDDEPKAASAPTVDQIRTILLRKHTNGSNS